MYIYIYYVNMYIYICMSIHDLHCIYICMHTYIHTYIHTYNIQTYIHTYVRTYVRMYIHTYLHTYIHAYIPTYLPTYINTHLPTFLPACMHACMPVCIDICPCMVTCVHAYICPLQGVLMPAHAIFKGKRGASATALRCSGSSSSGSTGWKMASWPRPSRSLVAIVPEGSLIPPLRTTYAPLKRFMVRIPHRFKDIVCYSRMWYMAATLGFIWSSKIEGMSMSHGLNS